MTYNPKLDSRQPPQHDYQRRHLHGPVRPLRRRRWGRWRYLRTAVPVAWLIFAVSLVVMAL